MKKRLTLNHNQDTPDKTDGKENKQRVSLQCQYIKFAHNETEMSEMKIKLIFNH